MGLEGLQPDLADGFGQAFEPVTGHDADIFDTAVAQSGEGGHPRLAPSPPVPAHNPSTSRTPPQLMPNATYTGRLATWPSRIFTKIASIRTTG